MALPAPVNQQNLQVRMNDGSFKRVCPFPVGYIYQSYTSTSPSDIYGGSWTPITGRFLYCNNGNGVGGANSRTYNFNHTHTQTDKHMPLLNYKDGTGYSYVAGTAVLDSWVATGESSWSNQGGVQMGVKKPLDNKTIDTMPAYQTCYAWRRTN